MVKLLFIPAVLILIPFSVSAAGASEETKTFELGVEQYRSGAYKEAAASFQESSKTRKGLQAVKLYNLGNALVKHAEQLLSTDSETAASLLEKSLTAYRRALEIEEEFPEAGYNMEVAKRLLSTLAGETEEDHDANKPREDEPGEQAGEQPPEPEMSEEDKKLIEEILENEQEKKIIPNQPEGSSGEGRSGKNW
jgi:Ca-activated chloride channel homolog